jgi:hypothetical protein
MVRFGGLAVLGGLQGSPKNSQTHTTAVWICGLPGPNDEGPGHPQL